ncbi:MAG: hypothetical protein FJY77_02690 [Candidatus Altiarchaeales archaeon]|nr:hypothetical protein [Candidatus Altiarchaeales archaeon]
MTGEWHAVEVLDKALGMTNQLLFEKFNLNLWLKLAFIVFLITGSFSLNGISNFIDKDSDAKYIPVIVIILAVSLVIGLVFAFIRAVAQFMFIESLTTKGVEIIKGFKRNLDSGFNLFLFNIAFFLIAIILIMAIIIPVIFLMFVGIVSSNALIIIPIILLTVVVVLAVSIVLSLVGMLNTDFAIVLMHKEREGMVNAWKRLLGLVKKDGKQFAVYTALKIALAVLASMIEMVVSIVLLIAYLVSMLIIGILLGVIAYSGGIDFGKSLLIWVPAIIIAIIGFVIMSYVYSVIVLPIYVFFRYYSLLFLGRIEPAVNLMGEQRTARTEEEKTVESSPAGGKRKPRRKLKVH